MNQAEMYRFANPLQRRDAEEILKEFQHRIQWSVEGTDEVLDIGCGDGSVTFDTLLPRVPAAARVCGGDVSAAMLKYANANFPHRRLSFRELDIAEKAPLDEHERYRHIFSFYCLHWVQEQRTAWTNIYDMLAPGGDCLHVFLARNPIYDIRKTLSKMDRWAKYMYDIDSFISPYHYSKDPKTELEDLMKRCGFSEVDVECRERIYYFTDLNVTRKAMLAVSPETQRIPEHLKDDFLEDYVEILRSLNLVESDDNNNEDENLKHYFQRFIKEKEK